jgi:hypothetical protein
MILLCQFVDIFVHVCVCVPQFFNQLTNHYYAWRGRSTILIIISWH